MTIVSKVEAAKRQLDAAIHLLFDGGDQLAIRTLAGAAFNLLADLMDRQATNTSFRSRLIANSGMSEKNAIAALNTAQNFLKHADRDPDAILEFDEEENNDVLFVAALEFSALGNALSPSMQAFQVWFINLYSSRFTDDGQRFIQARFPGPNLKTLSMQESLKYGKGLIKEAELLLSIDTNPSALGQSSKQFD